MRATLILFVIMLCTVIGDWCIKVSTEKEGGMATPMFVFGAVMYGLPAIGWYMLMREHALAAIAVYYSASTLILMSLLGVFAFKEAFGMREAFGLTLALASVVVMIRES